MNNPHKLPHSTALKLITRAADYHDTPRRHCHTMHKHYIQLMTVIAEKLINDEQYELDDDMSGYGLALYAQAIGGFLEMDTFAQSISEMH